MKILVLDCAFNPTVAIIVDGEEKVKNVNLQENHSDGFMRLIDKSLKDVKMLLSDIDIIAVNVGPGSFTGLRVAVSIVKGFAFGDDKKVLPFTSFDYVETKNNVLVSGFSNFVYKKNTKNVMSCEQIGLLKKSAKYVVFDLNLYEKLIKYGLKLDFIEKKSYSEILKNKNKFVKINELEPLYLRKSQAEIEKENRKNG